MARLVLISARAHGTAGAGGVAVALGDVFATTGGLWLAWSGDVSPTVDAATESTHGLGTILTTPLSPSEHRDFYLGYANSVLWPTFHNRVDLALYEAGYFTAYESVNERFAAMLAPRLRADDVIWVHDYQFIPLAERLRARGVTNPIGFFLHIPFPPTLAFLAIPEFARIGHALAAYDLVGLQSTSDVGSMIRTLQDAVSAQILSDGRLRIGSRLVSIGRFPIGSDPMPSFGGSEPALPKDDAPLRLVGVDRLDYTKGLPQKFRAFGRFLDRCPGFRRKVVLTQIAAPTRESLEAYSDIRAELEQLSGAINGRYGEPDWVPLQYINRSAQRATLPALYRSARVGLVTPLIDGMNLVASEYVLAQDGADPGVLILSRFAGAAEQMPAALTVNPYDIDGVADAMRIALEMPLDERRRRHDALLGTIGDNDTAAWSQSFLAALARTQSRDPAPTDRFSRALSTAVLRAGSR